MRFENQFSAPASADEVFDAMLDLRFVASCLPGTKAEDETADGAMEATVAIKVGPIRVTYAGTVSVENADHGAHTAVLRVDAREQRGQGGAQASVDLSIEEEDGGALVRMVTDLTVSGRVAQMGSGVMQEVANSMVSEFAACLASRLATDRPDPARSGVDESASAQPTPDTPQRADGGGELRLLRLVRLAIGRRIRRLLARG